MDFVPEWSYSSSYWSHCMVEGVMTSMTDDLVSPPRINPLNSNKCFCSKHYVTYCDPFIMVFVPEWSYSSSYWSHCVVEGVTTSTTDLKIWTLATNDVFSLLALKTFYYGIECDTVEQSFYYLSDLTRVCTVE